MAVQDFWRFGNLDIEVGGVMSCTPGRLPTQARLSSCNRNAADEHDCRPETDARHRWNGDNSADVDKLQVG